MANFIDNFKRFCGDPALALLIGINIGVWAVVGLVVLFCRLTGVDDNWASVMFAVSSVPVEVAMHPWTVVTYMVTQFSLIHLLFNMLWLFWFGRLALTLLTSRRLLTVYIGGGLAGAVAYILASLIFRQATGAYLIGSSASVMAVMTAAAFLTPDLKVSLVIFGDVKLKWLALVCVALTFFGSASSSTAGSLAHLGGILFGMVYAMKFRGIFRRKTAPAPELSPWERRYGKPRKVKRNGKAVALAARNLTDSGRLDFLLDKIRLSGYDSLSEGERNELTLLSQRLKKDS